MVGMNQQQLEQLADKEGAIGPCKVSRRDLSASIALKRNGGTTVAGTM